MALVCLPFLLAIAETEARPAMRPALIGNTPHSLINQIDATALAARGQGNAVIMFQCYVNQDGYPSSPILYRGTPNSTLLEREVKKSFVTSRFEPAYYENKLVIVIFRGTVVFTVNNGAPHLRIFANQEQSELLHENDFIAPQFVITTTDWGAANQILYQVGGGRPRNGVTQVEVSVSATGRPSDCKIISEDPGRIGLGPAALKVYGEGRFVPAFRNGKPAACRTRLIHYVNAGSFMTQ